jgi:O-methyltransferase involved in polyketide biosynthesis|tara:strand:- start:312 stop:1172 length:861 start_codon:yes stop_codon:yes gene_type:complete
MEYINNIDTSIDTSRISISAHYTGYIWYKNGLSPKQFVTPMGRAAYWALKPMNVFMQSMIGASIDTFLLQRHFVLDHLVEQAIEEGFEQIVELAAGLSSRGYLIKKKYPNVHYVEGDLPSMSARKSELLDTLGRPLGHFTQPCNILDESGPLSIEMLLGSLDTTKKTLIITEGLVNYFDLPTIRKTWARMAVALKPFPQARYITEVYPKLEQHPSYKYVKVAQKVVGFFTQGEYPLHYNSNEAMQQGFLDDGFAQVSVTAPEDYYDKLNMVTSSRQSLVRLVVANV